nr:uncharacterized protein LOC123289243 [Equus asinus]
MRVALGCGLVTERTESSFFTETQTTGRKNMEEEIWGIDTASEMWGRWLSRCRAQERGRRWWAGDPPARACPRDITQGLAVKAEGHPRPGSEERPRRRLQEGKDRSSPRGSNSKDRGVAGVLRALEEIRSAGPPKCPSACLNHIFYPLYLTMLAGRRETVPPQRGADSWRWQTTCLQACLPYTDQPIQSLQPQPIQLSRTGQGSPCPESPGPGTRQLGTPLQPGACQSYSNPPVPSSPCLASPARPAFPWNPRRWPWLCSPPPLLLADPGGPWVALCGVAWPLLLKTLINSSFMSSMSPCCHSVTYKLVRHAVMKHCPVHPLQDV